jgi:hypothetical protein
MIEQTNVIRLLDLSVSLARHVRACANLEVVWIVMVMRSCILTTLRHPLYNAVVLDIVRVVGLDVSG